MVSVAEERSAIAVHAKTRSHDLPSLCNCNGQNGNVSCLHMCGFLMTMTVIQLLPPRKREHVLKCARILGNLSKTMHLEASKGFHVREEPPTADSTETQVGIPAICAVWGSP